MHVPKKFWWTTAIVVPVALALIGAYAEFSRGRVEEGGAPGVLFAPIGYGNALNQAGRDINSGAVTNYAGDVAYTTLQLVPGDDPLTAEVVALVERAMDALEGQKLDRAIPLLETAAELAPRPAILNNLGAAYLAAGDEQRAGEVLAKAKQTEAPTDVAAAVRHNLRQVELAPLVGALSPMHPTDIDGFLAEVTRFDDRGGLATLEVTYWNRSNESVRVCLSPEYNYLLDEVNWKQWQAVHFGGGACRYVNPGQPMITWAKFAIEADQHPLRLTAVAHRVPRPFENLSLGGGSEAS